MGGSFGRVVNNYVYRTGNGITAAGVSGLTCTGNAVINCSKRHAAPSMDDLKLEEETNGNANPE